MATREDNLALAKRGYEMFSSGDLEGLRELFSPDIIWRTTSSLFEAEYKGPDEVFGYFGKLFEFSDGTFKSEPMYMLADDDRVMVMQHVSATHASKLLDTTVVHVFELEGSKVYEVTEYVSEPAKLEAFWS